MKTVERKIVNGRQARELKIDAEEPGNHLPDSGTGPVPRQFLHKGSDRIGVNTRDTYLSVDLDFWSQATVDLDFLRRLVADLGPKNVAAAVEHESILCHVRRYGGQCQVLFNLDTHSDLGGVMDIHNENGGWEKRRLELHSGSWVDYVSWPERREFIWAYPDFFSREDRRCDHFSLETPFGLIPQRDPIGDLDQRWLKLRRRFASPPNYGIPFERVRAGSITLSPEFCGSDACQAFKKIVREFDLELLDLVPEDLELLEPSLAELQAHRPHSRCNDVIEVPVPARQITAVEWVEPPESSLPQPVIGDSDLREILQGYCWSTSVPTVGCLVQAEGAWYDLRSDVPEDGVQDRALCPTKLWQVESVYPCPSRRNRATLSATGGRKYRIVAVGDFVSLLPVKNKRGSEGIARQIGGCQ
jgi:hypothetical protein